MSVPGRTLTEHPLCLNTAIFWYIVPCTSYVNRLWRNVYFHLQRRNSAKQDTGEQKVANPCENLKSYIYHDSKHESSVKLTSYSELLQQPNSKFKEVNYIDTARLRSFHIEHTRQAFQQDKWDK
jgi:hypothetical protein